MTSQRHQIQRQIIDITVADQSTGQRLHEELSRLQREIIEPLVDRCCSELSAPDRVHRIPRIELDLGNLSLDDLKHELTEKLEPALREALAAKILEEEQLSAMLGEDPAAMAQAELISLFARTGALPFWADTSRPRVVDESVEKLMAADSRLLVTLVRDLSRDGRALRRFVRHVEPERLRALFEALVNASIPAGTERADELWELLAMTSSTTVVISKAISWVSALETALSGESTGDAVAFFREVLGRVAMEIGAPYRSVVMALFEASGARTSARTRGMGRVLAALADEVGGGEKVPGTFSRDARPVAARFSDAHGTPNSSASPAQTTGRLRERLKIRAVTSNLDEKVPGTFLGGVSESEKVPGTFGEGVSESEKVQSEKVPGTFGEGVREGENPDAGQQEVIVYSDMNHHRESVDPRIRDRFSQSSTGVSDQTTMRELRDVERTVIMAREASAPRRNDPIDDADVSAAPRRDVSDNVHVSAAPRCDVTYNFHVSAAPRRDVTDNVHVSAAPRRDVTDNVHVSVPPRRDVPDNVHVSVSPGRDPSTSVQSVESRQREASTSPKVPTTFAEAPDARPNQPLRSPPNPRPSIIHEEPDQIYLDTSGLVLIWPFLATYFDRLELLADKKSFIDDAARARAVLLLQYLATTDPDPPEYRLALAKVLCGMPFDDLFALASEPTEAEVTEGANLLSAVLQHAKIFGEVSTIDFREAFLIRRGILSTRDGAWLLRVEQAPYDLILQQLPWPLNWVRLPWMQAPLYVEWIR